jgi:hypothetical protein
MYGRQKIAISAAPSNQALSRRLRTDRQAPFALAPAALAGENQRMLKMTRLAFAAVAALTLGSGAVAQNAPAGWVLEKTPGQWVASSPDQGRGLRVKLVYKTVQPATGSLALWFPEAHQIAAREFGEITALGRVDAVNQQGMPPMLASSIAVKPPQGGRAAVVAYGYDTAKGRQLVMILLPSTLSKRNPAYRAAFSAMDEYWRIHGVYQPTAEAALTPAP